MMRIFFKIGVGLAIAAFCISPAFKTSPKKGEIIMAEPEGNQTELFMRELGIEEDSAQGIVDELGNVGASKIVKVEPLSVKKGYQALATDVDGKVYCIFLGGLGYLETIRKDSPEGEILYAAID